MPSLYPGNIGGTVTSVQGIFPKSQAAAAAFSLKGTGLDRTGIESLLAVISVGAVDAGTFTLDGKLQHSDTDVDGNYADVATNPQNTKVALTQMTTANKVQHLEVDCRGLKRFVRMVFTVAFAGGGAALLISHEFITDAMIAAGGGVTQT